MIIFVSFNFSTNFNYRCLIRMIGLFFNICSLNIDNKFFVVVFVPIYLLEFDYCITYIKTQTQTHTKTKCSKDFIAKSIVFWNSNFVSILVCSKQFHRVFSNCFFLYIFLIRFNRCFVLCFFFCSWKLWSRWIVRIQNNIHIHITMSFLNVLFTIQSK